jgi:molecular chaperone GrpE
MTPDEKDDVEQTPDDDMPNDSGNGKDEEIHIEVLDPDAPSMDDSEEEAPPEPTAFLKTISELKKQRDDHYDRLLRKQADFENYRKRAEKEKRDFQQYALTDFVLELVAIVDNFDRAVSHGEDQAGAEYRKGIDLIHRQLRDLLEKKGLRTMDTEGKAFDPMVHEAILREHHDELPENTILQELQKGYYFREKLLRPAMVKVSFREEKEPKQEVEPGEDEPVEE